MRPTGLIDWKEAPFLRFIPPFITGILIEWYSGLPAAAGWILATTGGLGLLFSSRLSISRQFRCRPVNGLLLCFLLLASGYLVAYYKDIRHHPQWFPYRYAAGDTLIATIDEPLVQKTKTWKTTVTLQAVRNGQRLQAVKGKCLLYLPQNSDVARLHYGSQLLFTKIPESIRHTGNPHAFDYRRYCAFKGVFHQLFLRKHEYIFAEKKPINPVKNLVYHTRKKMLDIIRENITGKKQAGLAEALLIGYKDDLDKQLLQSYINTGVVHIIAVSGMHLGLLYAILLFLCKQLPKRWQRILPPVIIIGSLWLFALLAGAVPSVLRAAVMFTFLVIGHHLPHRSPAFNSLAASGFLLLWYDPWLCWDPGFQLSYAAVASILLFRKPVYNLLPISNKYLDYGWKLIAVTIAAQILTLPVSVYHFHQFPNLFLVTNLLAVPLSGLILVGELLLCGLAFITPLAKAIGWILNGLLRLLNGFIETINQVPFNTTDGIQLSLWQTLLLYGMIAGLTCWFSNKKKNALLAALAACWLFLLLHTQSKWAASRQQKLVVYNVPGYQAIDLIDGRQYVYRGDSGLQQEAQLENFHLRPSRTAFRITPAATLPNLLQTANCFQLGSCSGVLIENALPAAVPAEKIPVDLIILSRNSRVSIHQLMTVFDCSRIVIDATNSPWKTRSWQEDCRKLGIACHAMASEGAFVLNLH